MTREDEGRAIRFGLQLPLRYRLIHDHRWHVGVTESISSTGVVIRGNERVHLAERLLIVVSFPDTAGCLIGRGRLVRVLMRGGSRSNLFAVAVPRYRLSRRARLLPTTH